MKDIIVKRLALDKYSQTPIYRQLSDLICTLAEEGTIKPNEKLPPIRKLSEALGVNNVTIVNAYKYLENKKTVYSIIGSGTYVSELIKEDKPFIAESMLNKQMEIHVDESFDVNEIINFAKGSAPAELFPVSEFKRLFNLILDRDKGKAFGYEQIQGYEPLRHSFCDYVKGFGITATADKIQVISGAQQGIDIIAKAILSPGDAVLTESPTYYGAAGAFLSRGAKVTEVPLESNGMDINKLTALIKLYRPKIVYIMPYFQTPTCINTSLDKKRKILELAYKYDFYIIEEDNQSDFNFTGYETVPLKALDYKNKVIYIKSFSKILMPGLRIGLMILPKAALKKVLSAKYTTDIETSGFIQRAFDLFLKSDDWDKHILKMKNIFRSRYDKMRLASNKYLKDKLEYSIPEGGLNFWFKLPEGIQSKDFCNQLIKKGVIVYPGAIYSLDGSDLPYIRLSFANVEDNKIEEGIKRISVTV